jgi:hypothetical protein
MWEGERGHNMKEADPRYIAATELLERTGDLDLVKRTYPELAEFCEDYWRIRRLLNEGENDPLSHDVSSARIRFLSAVAAPPRKRGLWAIQPLRFFAFVVAGGFVLTAAIGASAAGGVDTVKPARQVLQTLGVTEGEHGKAVSDAVQDAINSTPPGPERGRAVAEAACRWAHERGNLPLGAQNAPGFANEPAKTCPEDNEVEIEEDEDSAGGPPGGPPGPARALAARAAACVQARLELQPGEPDPEVCRELIPQVGPLNQDEDEDENEGQTPPAPGNSQNTTPGPANEQLGPVEACRQLLSRLAPGQAVPEICRPLVEDKE